MYNHYNVNIANFIKKRARVLVIQAKGQHLFPFRTQQLSPSAPMILLSGKVGHRQDPGSFFVEKKRSSFSFVP
jgi:hypothetical protein